MTFDKYRDKTNLPINTVLPKENYDYEYVWTKRIGWRQIKGDKIKMNNAEVNKTVNDIIERNKERRIRKLNMTDKFLFINRSSIDRVN